MPTPFTCIYSSECIEPAKNLVNTFLSLFAYKEKLSFDDLFYAGVFCKPETYANYRDFYNNLDAVEDEYIIALTSPCSTEQERLNLVEGLIIEIMKGEKEKPEWMVMIEATEVCGDYEMPPSTFLYLICKDEKYQPLADAMIRFLYSPNLMITMLED